MSYLIPVITPTSHAVLVRDTHDDAMATAMTIDLSAIAAGIPVSVSVINPDGDTVWAAISDQQERRMFPMKAA